MGLDPRYVENPGFSTDATAGVIANNPSDTRSYLPYGRLYAFFQRSIYARTTVYPRAY